MTGGLLENLWNNKGNILGDIFNFDAPKKEVELGADWDTGKALSNFFPSMKEEGQGILHMVKHPVETGGLLGNLLTGAVGHTLPEFVTTGLEKVAPDNLFTNNKEMASQAWQEILKTHGGRAEFKKYANENPFAAMLELSGAGLIAKQVKNITAPHMKNAIENIELQVSKGMDAVESFGRKIEDAFPNFTPYVPMATVHHGSPYKYDKLSTKFMKSGEGAHAYGWGLYMADHPDTAKTYEPRDMWYEEELYRKYQDAHENHRYNEADLWERAMFHDSPSEIRKYSDEVYGKGNHNEALDEMMHLHREADFGRYTIDLPDSAINTMIDLELPVYAQPQVVKDFLSKEYPRYMELVEQYKPLQELEDALRVTQNKLAKDAGGLLHYTDAEYRAKINNVDVETIYKRKEVYNNKKLQRENLEKIEDVLEQQRVLAKRIDALDVDIPHPMNGGGIYDWLVSRQINEMGIPTGVEKIVSQNLDAAGIKGLKYLDQHSRGTGIPDKQTRNYVVFHEDTARILTRNDEVIN